MSIVSKPCNNMIKSAAFLMSFSYFLNKTVTTVNVEMHYVLTPILMSLQCKKKKVNFECEFVV